MKMNAMPESMWLNKWCDATPEPPEGVSIEYIRADVATAQLDAANKRIAELESAQRWISVHERLPDAEVDVLCKCASGIVIAWLAPNVAQYGVKWLASRGSGSITHWMPLPPPPVMGKTEKGDSKP